jgi:predicted metal-dependent HD superfamily phosphohydrolase
VTPEDDNLRRRFTKVASKFCERHELVEAAWSEIVTAYTGPRRYYHNLVHLHNMLQNLDEVRSEVQNFDATLFALYYHDIVYVVGAGNNETKSAQRAGKRLEEFGADKSTKQKVTDLILATEKHEQSGDHDLNCFTDADLSILGSDQSVYANYTAAIRREYETVPEFLYRPGRKKILKHFLAMATIFKTAYFKRKYEEKARVNMQWELNGLNEPLA